MKTAVTRLFAGVFALTLLASVGVAHEGPCHADAQKLCPNLKWGHGLGKCLEQNEAQISNAACKSKIAVAEANHPCAGDVKSFCAQIQPGGGRIHGCLEQNMAKLSQACQRKLASHD